MNCAVGKCFKFLINLWMGFLICLDLVSSNGLCTVTFIYDGKGVLNRELLQFRILGGGGGGLITSLIAGYIFWRLGNFRLGGRRTLLLRPPLPPVPPPMLSYSSRLIPLDQTPQVILVSRIALLPSRWREGSGKRKKKDPVNEVNLWSKITVNGRMQYICLIFSWRKFFVLNCSMFSAQGSAILS